MTNSKERNIVIYRMGSLGDTIVALPVLHKIIERYPDHKRIFLTDLPISGKAAPIDAILENTGIVHGKIGYPIGTRDPKILLNVLKQLRSYKPEALIYVGGGRKNGVKSTWRDLMFFRLAGIRNVIGAPLWKSLDRGLLDDRTGWIEYEAERLARCLQKGLGTIDLTDPKYWDLKLTAAENAKTDEILGDISGGFFVINTGGKLPIQDWGEQNWADLLSILNQRMSLPIIVIGSSEDRQRAENILQNWQHKKLNLCGIISPRISAAVLKRAMFFVGHDSGPLHLAAAVGLRCIGLFSSNDPPGKWYPRGAHTILRNDEDIRLIRPETVAESVMKLHTTVQGVNKC
jgi:ADP-heptose:LPS heptosyltransferase